MLNVQEDEVRKGGGGEEGRLLATYAPASSCPRKKREFNDRRTGFTSFRALFAPLRTMCCLKRHFYFWTENIECVRRIFSFCLLRDSCFVVFLENLAITCIRSHIYAMIALLLACYRSYGKTIFGFSLSLNATVQGHNSPSK